MLTLLYTSNGKRCRETFTRLEFAMAALHALPKPNDATLWHGATRLA